MGGDSQSDPGQRAFPQGTTPNQTPSQAKSFTREINKLLKEIVPSSSPRNWAGGECPGKSFPSYRSLSPPLAYRSPHHLLSKPSPHPARVPLKAFHPQKSNSLAQVSTREEGQRSQGSIEQGPLHPQPSLPCLQMMSSFNQSSEMNMGGPIYGSVGDLCRSSSVAGLFNPLAYPQQMCYVPQPNPQQYPQQYPQQCLPYAYPNGAYQYPTQFLTPNYFNTGYQNQLQMSQSQMNIGMCGDFYGAPNNSSPSFDPRGGYCPDPRGCGFCGCHQDQDRFLMQGQQQPKGSQGVSSSQSQLNFGSTSLMTLKTTEVAASVSTTCAQAICSMLGQRSVQNLAQSQPNPPPKYLLEPPSQPHSNPNPPIDDLNDAVAAPSPTIAKIEFEIEAEKEADNVVKPLNLCGSKSRTLIKWDPESIYEMNDSNLPRIGPPDKPLSETDPFKTKTKLPNSPRNRRHSRFKTWKPTKALNEQIKHNSEITRAAKAEANKFLQSKSIEAITLNEISELLQDPLWSNVSRGFKALGHQAKVNSEEVIDSLQRLVPLALISLKSLKSKLTREALSCFKELFTHLGPNMDGFLERGLGEKLFIKTMVTNEFIKQDTEEVLVAIVKECSPGKVILYLETCGARHKNGIVRRAACRMIKRFVDLYGPAEVMEFYPDKVIPMLVKFMEEASVEMRDLAKEVIKELIVLPSFDICVKHYVGVELQWKVKRRIERIRDETRGIESRIKPKREINLRMLMN